MCYRQQLIPDLLFTKPLGIKKNGNDKLQFGCSGKSLGKGKKGVV